MLIVNLAFTSFMFLNVHKLLQCCGGKLSVSFWAASVSKVTFFIATQT